MTGHFSEDEWSRLKKLEELRRQSEEDQCIDILKSGSLITATPAEGVVNSRVGETRLRILRHHPYWKELSLRRGLSALIEAAQSAHLDLCRHEAALTAYARRRQPFTDHIDHTVSNPAQKEVLAFCAACHGTIDTLRRVSALRPDLANDIDRYIKTVGASPDFQFIKDLRKNLSHGSVVVPNWVIKNVGSEGSSGVISLDCYELMAFGEWGASAKNFINASTDGRIAISIVTDTCVRLITENFAKLTSAFSTNTTAQERDYYNIEDSYRRVQGRQQLKVLLNAFQNHDPYIYLHHFFSAEEVREILRLPNNSREQVEFIISLKGAELECDDSLRATLYNIFKVA